MPLLLLPKSRPLSWVGIWSAARRAAFLFFGSRGRSQCSAGVDPACAEVLAWRPKRSHGARRSKLYIACSGFFFKKPEGAHAAAPPPQIPTAELGRDLVGRPEGGDFLFWIPREIALLGGNGSRPGPPLAPSPVFRYNRP